MRVFLKKLLFLNFISFVLQIESASALPIGFGINQGRLQYDELKSEHFIVYHDARTPGEGRMIMNALEAARPTMERWFAHKRGRLPVVVSAVTDNASFANFITDAIELQTMGQSSKDLAWHEYTHTTMYEYYHNVFGPAGSILHLPWMPAWFIEGLAETTSVSSGSDTTAGIERFQALTGDWPSYARLHSLYNSRFSERGYATSGALTTWFLRENSPNDLPKLLADFRSKSQPWWWPVSIIPWKSYLPFDRSLREYTQNAAQQATPNPNTAPIRDGEDLYTRYKNAATQHWRDTSKAKFLFQTPGPKIPLSDISKLQVRGNELLAQRHDENGDATNVTLQFEVSSGWAKSFKTQAKPNKNAQTYTSFSTDKISTDESIFYIGEKQTQDANTPLDKNNSIKIKRSAYIFALFNSPRYIVWLEQAQERNRLCLIDKTGLKEKPNAKPRITCPYETRQPKTVRLAGTHPLSLHPDQTNQDLIDEIWLTEAEEKLTGTNHRLRVFDLKTASFRPDVFQSAARPMQVAFAGSEVWLLLAERSKRSLRRIQHDKLVQTSTPASLLDRCEGMLQFSDHILGVYGLADGRLVVTLYGGQNNYAMQLPKAMRNETRCTPEDAHISPLLYAMQHPGSDFATALQGASLWKQTPQPLLSEEARQLAKAPALDKATPPDTSIKSNSPARWRPRPVLAFPWIGAEDALGPQFGLVSVPLMDEMQNETIRATFLYGPASHYPYQEVSLTSTRFTPTLSLVAYRQQTYNGRFASRTNSAGYENSYLDEKGARLESSWTMRALAGAASVDAGVKYAHLKPYMGPSFVRSGFLAEPSLSLGLTHSFGAYTWSQELQGRVAPDWLNEEFDYNQIGASTSLTRKMFWASRFTLGLEGSRTRGKKERELKEVYRPLKTFVPGSGGGYNKNSFPLNGGDEGLFAAMFGDTQARAKASWTVPLVAELDKLVWILYLERLDFTAFYNYGAAWRGEEPAFGWDHLMRAHGYNVDLQLENKGFRFNLGLGTGQVIGRAFEVYMTSGFDALF